MSHDATNWAIKQRGIKPALKVVLWHLCDCHNPAFGGAFPSQEYLAEQCEIPRSTLNVYLDGLEKAGLIIREQRRKPGSQTQERTRYFFPFEPDFAAKKAAIPCPETGHGTAEAESRNEGEPSPENGESRVQNLDSNPVREPVKEPVKEREARELENSKEDPKKVDAAFWSLVKDWPGFDLMGKDQARKLWHAMNAEDRRLAALRYPVWRKALKDAKKDHVPTPQTYFRNRLWEAVHDPVVEPEKPSVQNPFSRPWMARFLAEVSKPMSTTWPAMSLYQRQQAANSAEDAVKVDMERRRKHGWPKASSMIAELRPVTVEPWLVALSEGFVGVDPASDLAKNWGDFFERMGMPWPVSGYKWLHLPPGEPADAMSEFQRQLSEGRGDDDAA